MDARRDKSHQLSSEFVLQLSEAQPRMYVFLLKRLGHHDQVREVLQEVNLVLCRKADEFEPGTNFMAWAYSIARFQVMAYRQSLSRDRLVFPGDLSTSLDQLDSELQRADEQEARQLALRDCIGELPAEHRELIVKRYAESNSVKAIAADLEKTANAVSLVLHRIREQLFKCIEHKMESENPL